MTINAGVARDGGWQRVAFKGGNDHGVMNLTFHLRSEGGSTYCVSTTWNDAVALDEEMFAGLTASLIDAVRAFDEDR